MNKIISLFILAFSLSVSAHDNAAIDSLIKAQQYKTAWTKISSQKKSVNNELEKIDFALKYFTKTISHQAFAFTNLKTGENLIQQRRLAEQRMIPVTPYKIDSVLAALASKNPDNGNVFKAQGDYYYDIFVLYGQDWIESKQEVLRRMYTAYDRAEKLNTTDYLTYYGLGYFYNLNEDWQKAKSYFEKSLELDSNYAPTHYNLAYIFLEIDSNERALYHAYQAYQLYRYINYKNDAGQMAGSILAKLNRHEEAISLLLDCDRLIPNTYYTYYYLLNSFLATNRDKEAEITTENIFAMDWKSHTINTDLIELYVKYKKSAELESFYLKKLEKEQYDMEFRGHTFLHLSQMFSLNSNQEKTKEYLIKAKNSFEICYDSGHPIFRVLNKMEANLN